MSEGHCKQLAPHYAKAATKLKKLEPEAALAKIDCDAEKDIGEKFGVKGFPTLKWFVNGDAQEYGGGYLPVPFPCWLCNVWDGGRVGEREEGWARREEKLTRRG
eukprot:1276737-Rhodomonas_salina.1